MEAYSAAPCKGGAGVDGRRVTVATTARLHFGFLDPSGRSARPFGSFGLSLDRPETRLKLAHASEWKVTGPERERAERYLRTVAEASGVSCAYALDIEAAIPPHAGLGSGTQLALAVGSAFAALEGLDLSPQAIAARLGRGARSGIGIFTFEHGGAVLDSGPEDGALPLLRARHPFPADWRVILIFDDDARGLAGAGETAAFESLPDFPAREREALRREVIDVALPALAAHDFAAFSQSIGLLQTRMGAYFAPLQGGPCTSKRVGAALDVLQAQGLTGLGQSSWGPTGFGFVSSAQEGEALLARLRAEPQAAGLRFTLAKGRNEGAVIETKRGKAT